MLFIHPCNCNNRALCTLTTVLITPRAVPLNSNVSVANNIILYNTKKHFVENEMRFRDDG